MNPSNFFARYRSMNSAAMATGYEDALTSWGSTLRGATSMLARGQSTVRSVAPSSARSQASYADAWISSDGCVLGGVALAAAPCTSGRAFGSTRASASSEATTRARRRFCLSSRQRYRRSRHDSSIDAGSLILQCRLASATSAREPRAPVSALLRLHHLVCARHRHPPLTTAAPLGGAPLLPTGPPFRAFCQL